MMCVLILIMHSPYHYTEGDRHSKVEADERKLDAEGDSLDGKKPYTMPYTYNYIIQYVFMVIVNHKCLWYIICFRLG